MGCQCNGPSAAGCPGPSAACSDPSISGPSKFEPNKEYTVVAEYSRKSRVANLLVDGELYLSKHALMPPVMFLSAPVLRVDYSYDTTLTGPQPQRSGRNAAGRFAQLCRHGAFSVKHETSALAAAGWVMGLGHDRCTHGPHWRGLLALLPHQPCMQALCLTWGLRHECYCSPPCGLCSTLAWAQRLAAAYQRTGSLLEVHPHAPHWSMLSGLVADGFDWTRRGGQGKVSARRTILL